MDMVSRLLDILQQVFEFIRSVRIDFDLASVKEGGLIVVIQ